MATDPDFIVSIEQDPDTGELLLPFPEELLKQLGWNTGDELEWFDNGDGSFTISKDLDRSQWKMLKSNYE
jgi:antitoxin component of MazEF toxin-antitoxin module